MRAKPKAYDELRAQEVKRAMRSAERKFTTSEEGKYELENANAASIPISALRD